MQHNYQALFPECYLLFPKPADDVLQVVDKIKVRKIFEGQVEFDQQEMKILADFDRFLRQKNFKEQWTSAQKLRMLYANKFKFDKTISAMVAYSLWRQAALPPKESPEAIQFLKGGAIYLHGRDHRYRPIIVVNATKLAAYTNIQVTLDALTIFLEYVLNHYMLPGQIENWVVLMDLGGLGITSLPRQQLQRVLDYLQNNYRSRMHRCYVVNCPGTITFSWSVVKGFLEEITVRKISFEGRSVAPALFSHTHASQVEKMYGGTAPSKVADYWPPREISNKYFLEADRPEDVLVTKQQYQRMYREGELAKNLVCQQLLEELNQSVQKSTLDVKQRLSEPEDEQDVIDKILFGYKNQYVRNQITDEFQVQEQEGEIQIPHTLQCHKKLN